MPEMKREFKIPPKKYHPTGLSILFEDHAILVVDKVNGLLTVSTDKEREKTAHFLLNDYVRKGNHRSKNRVFIVHRLDRETSGVLIFAKSEKVKSYLQEQWKDFNKMYLAVVHGRLDEKDGEITSYLAQNKMHRMYAIADPAKGKLAKTGYKTISASKSFSLLEINLYTGRKHQIRVHLADKGHPVVGDKMYGKSEKGVKRLMLHAHSLTIDHPITKERLTFETKVPTYFNTFVKN